MLTRKHFNYLVKIHAEALKEARQGNFEDAYSIFEFKLRDFYKTQNLNYNDFEFETETGRLARIDTTIKKSA